MNNPNPNPPNMLLTGDRLAAIEGRAQAATPGPWLEVRIGDVWSVDSETPSGTVATLDPDDGDGVDDWDEEAARDQVRANAVFTAHGRQDVPWLTDQVRQLRARVAELEEDAAFLRALEAAGVDNWEGYDGACEIANGD